MSLYPPPPYPRKPRYRVQSVLGEPWREVSDEELRYFGDDPADYLPGPVAPQKRLFSSQERWGDGLAALAWLGGVLLALHYTNRHISTLETLGLAWVGSLCQGVAKRFFYIFFSARNATPPAPAAPATV